MRRYNLAISAPLHGADAKVTGPRERVFELLKLGPATALTLQTLGIPVTSGRRTLKLFEKIGIVREIGPGLYELTDQYYPHRHAITCRECGRAEMFRNEALEAAITKVLTGGYKVEYHAVELTGLCATCRRI